MQRINQISGKNLIVLSLATFVLVVYGDTLPPESDEGGAAHIFQLLVVAWVPTFLLSFTSANWGQPLRRARTMGFSILALVLAFGALYYLEHYFYPEHYR